MSRMERFLRKPHLILSLTLLSAAAGVLGYRSLPMNLFPDTNPPVVSVVTRWPGATAEDVATEVTHPLEVRLSAIDRVRRVTSTSRDQVSSVQVEFDYGVEIETAANQVTTELPRVRGSLPSGIADPLIFKITDAARPLVVLAVRSAEGADLDLARVRRLAENPLRDRLLGIPDVAEVEVFGGEVRQVEVALDRNRLQAFGLTVPQVAAALKGSNLALPAGQLHRDGRRTLLTARTLLDGPEELTEVLVPLAGGEYVRVGDLGDVYWGAADATSLYRGNGEPAVAVSLLRGERGHAREVIAAVERALPAVRELFPMLDITVADTQGRLIDLTVENMLSALRDAVIMTLVVILLFLGDSRAALVTSLSLPFTYLLTFAAMKGLGYEFNMVTLTAVIIAVGLLADDAIVVIENIERRIRETGETGIRAAAEGTREIFLADASGTVSTVIVLIPIMFIGGFVEKVLRPLTVTLSVALIASFVVSVTIIPLLAPALLRGGSRDPLGFLLRPFQARVVDPVRRGYVHLVDWGLKRPGRVLLVVLALFVVSARQLPLLGRELMPLMDTGILMVYFEAEPDTDAGPMAVLAQEVEEAIRAEIPGDWLLSMSTVVGSEAGVKSFGASRLLQRGQTTVNLVDRFQRDRSLSDVGAGVRRRLQRIPGLISANAAEFGATPVSSLRGTVDVMLSGPDPAVLDRLADEVMTRLHAVRGFSGIERTWQGRSRRLELEVAPLEARLFGLTAGDVVNQLARQVGGVPAGRVRVAGENPIPVWARLLPEQRTGAEDFGALTVTTRSGRQIPLAALADSKLVAAPTAETHEALQPTVDVIGYRRDIAVTHLHDRVVSALEGLGLPRGYRLSYEGEIKQMDESFARLGKSLALGLLLLYFMLVITFRSFLEPLVIMAALPLAVIGASWAMVLADKHGCLPAFMGIILLMGIVVNNGILLVDFAKVARSEGASLRQALLRAVELHTRPILMTAGSSAVGMIPIALEWAVGIERLSPLAVVAIGGLIAGTFLTLLAVPVLYYLLESLRAQPGLLSAVGAGQSR